VVTGEGWTRAVDGIAWVSEMKISGVGVEGSIKTGVSAAVGTPLVGAIFTEISHARVTIMNKERKKRLLFIVEYPFILD
jgi:hypothetical protein